VSDMNERTSEIRIGTVILDVPWETLEGLHVQTSPDGVPRCYVAG
jgi:hypothetical protein